MDDDETFFTRKSDGYYYKDELVIPNSKYSIDENDEDPYTFNQNLTDDNYFIEKVFRDKVEEFLNDGGYKLYKSPTEGNMIVTLMNVSFTPQESLGRLIFSVSATAYEVMENTLDNLNDCGIIDIGEFEEDISADNATVLIG